MRCEALASDFVLGKGVHALHVLAPEECVTLGDGKGGVASWARETLAGAQSDFFVLFNELQQL